jgi:hypothetical protein
MSTTVTLAGLMHETSSLAGKSCGSFNCSLETIDVMSSEGLSDVFSDEASSSENTSFDTSLTESCGENCVTQWSQHVSEPAASSQKPKAAPKNRKQRAAKKNNKKDKPLCLDYLNGNCHRLRSYCRYYHPELSEVLPAGAEKKKENCEVWMLIGFCKFGENCWKQHPVTSVAPTVKAPRAAEHQQQEKVSGYNEVLESVDPVDLKNAAVLLKQVSINPENAVQLLFEHSLCHRKMLPILHAMTLNDSRTGHAYVKFLTCLRQRLSVEQHPEFDELFFDVVRGWLSRTLGVHTSTIVQRVRAVRNMKVFADALSCPLVGPTQVADIISLLTSNLETQSAEQQDLRVLLLSLLLCAVFNTYGPAAADCQVCAGFVGKHSDTQMALDRLFQLRAAAQDCLKQAEYPHAASLSVPCASGLDDSVVHNPYAA